MSIDVSKLSNVELKRILLEHGLDIGPITVTTRNLYEQKAIKLLYPQKNRTPSKSPSRGRPRSNSRKSSTPSILKSIPTPTTSGSRISTRSSEQASNVIVVSSDSSSSTSELSVSSGRQSNRAGRSPGSSLPVKPAIISVPRSRQQVETRVDSNHNNDGHFYNGTFTPEIGLMPASTPLIQPTDRFTQNRNQYLRNLNGGREVESTPVPPARPSFYRAGQSSFSFPSRTNPAQSPPPPPLSSSTSRQAGFAVSSSTSSRFAASDLEVDESEEEDQIRLDRRSRSEHRQRSAAVNWMRPALVVLLMGLGLAVFFFHFRTGQMSPKIAELQKMTCSDDPSQPVEDQQACFPLNELRVANKDLKRLADLLAERRRDFVCDFPRLASPRLSADSANQLLLQSSRSEAANQSAAGKRWTTVLQVMLRLGPTYYGVVALDVDGNQLTAADHKMPMDVEWLEWRTPSSSSSSSSQLPAASRIPIGCSVRYWIIGLLDSANRQAASFISVALVPMLCGLVSVVAGMAGFRWWKHRGLQAELDMAVRRRAMDLIIDMLKQNRRDFDRGLTATNFLEARACRERCLPAIPSLSTEPVWRDVHQSLMREPRIAVRHRVNLGEIWSWEAANG